MKTQFQDDQVGHDSVAEFAAMLSRFSRLQSINANAVQLPAGEWTVEDERTVLIASGLFAVAEQLQRVADALTAPEPLPLAIPNGGEDTIPIAD